MAAARSKDKPLRLRDKALIYLVSALGAALLRLLRATLRMEIRGAEHVMAFWEKGENVIVAFWHDRFLLLPFAYRGSKGIKVLISSSKDGELIARTIHNLGLETVRGSSTRGGGPALEGLIAAARNGYDVGITPDGPKGPRHVAKAGVAEVARATGRPVLPLTMSAVRGWRAGSWDRFFVPRPFARVILRWGPPIWADPGAGFEEDRVRMENALRAITREADTETGNPDPLD